MQAVQCCHIIQYANVGRLRTRGVYNASSCLEPARNSPTSDVDVPVVVAVMAHDMGTSLRPVCDAGGPRVH